MEDSKGNLKNFLESDDPSMIQKGIKNLFSRYYTPEFSINQYLNSLDGHLKERINEADTTLFSEYEELHNELRKFKADLLEENR